MPKKRGDGSSVVMVKVAACECTSNLWLIGVAIAETPFLCLGCGLEKTKGLVLRCPSCGSMSCGPCVEKEVAEMHAGKSALKRPA
jgi:hypothetical protein